MTIREDSVKPFGLRRQVLRLFTVAGLGAALPGSYSLAQKKAPKPKEEEDGFESMVNKVSDLEKRLGLYDLAQFTPKL